MLDLEGFMSADWVHDLKLHDFRVSREQSVEESKDVLMGKANTIFANLLLLLTFSVVFA